VIGRPFRSLNQNLQAPHGAGGATSRLSRCASGRKGRPARLPGNEGLEGQSVPFVCGSGCSVKCAPRHFRCGTPRRPGGKFRNFVGHTHTPLKGSSDDDLTRHHRLAGGKVTKGRSPGRLARPSWGENCSRQDERCPPHDRPTGPRSSSSAIRCHRWNLGVHSPPEPRRGEPVRDARVVSSAGDWTCVDVQSEGFALQRREKRVLVRGQHGACVQRAGFGLF
jgi:hypothetical protein